MLPDWPPEKVYPEPGVSLTTALTGLPATASMTVTVPAQMANTASAAMPMRFHGMLMPGCVAGSSEVWMIS